MVTPSLPPRPPSLQEGPEMGSEKQGSRSDLSSEKFQNFLLILGHTGISESDGIQRQIGVS